MKTKFNHNKVTDILIDANAFIEINGNNADTREFLKKRIADYLDNNRITLKEYLFIYRFITNCEM